MRPAALALAAFGLILTGCDSPPVGGLVGSRQQRETRAWTLVQEAVSDLATGATASGRGRIDSAVSLLGGDAEAKSRIALELLELGRPEAAERLLLPWLSEPESDRYPPLGWGVLCAAAAKRGEAATAMKARERALAAARREIGRFGERPQGDLERARRVRELLDLASYHGLDPIDGSAMIAACREAVAVARQSPLARSRLATALADHATTDAEREEAVETALESIQFHNEQGTTGADSAMFRDAYGWALLRRGKKGDVAAAMRVLADAAEESPDSPQIRFHLGLAMMAGGRPERAAVELGRAVLLRPDYPEAIAAKNLLERANPAAIPAADR